MSFRRLQAVSLMVPILGLAVPFALRRRLGESTAIQISLGFSAVWVVLLVVALLKYRRRALWLLVGAPVALWVPFIVTAIYVSCEFGNDCL